MEFTDLKRRDLLFYDIHRVGKDIQPAGHVAIVQNYGTPTPKVIHLNDSGILLNYISEDRLADTVFHSIRPSDPALADKAANTVYNWLIHSAWKQKPSRSGNSTVLRTRGIYNSFALAQASFRSSSYGRGARSFVRHLCSDCCYYPPVEFTQFSSSFDRGAFCSGFAIAAYQTALGEQLCPTHLALDARNTTPLRLKKYLDTHVYWQHSGTISIMTSLPF
ncbi:hypothetical protein [Candidatus Sororendozoicomonas aggregata]|uniref:hypothetical protein n=1 Tax=Candidatus Sororendozoicomonas aggregata TaxID=3073239 RepID=UPI002ED26C0A